MLVRKQWVLSRFGTPPVPAEGHQTDHRHCEPSAPDNPANRCTRYHSSITITWNRFPGVRGSTPIPDAGLALSLDSEPFIGVFFCAYAAHEEAPFHFKELFVTFPRIYILPVIIIVSVNVVVIVSVWPPVMCAESCEWQTTATRSRIERHLNRFGLERGRTCARQLTRYLGKGICEPPPRVLS